MSTELENTLGTNIVVYLRQNKALVKPCIAAILWYCASSF